MTIRSQTCVVVIALALAGGGAEVVSTREPGPIAVAMHGPRTALYLRADGRVVRFDTEKAMAGDTFYQVPKDFTATDLAGASGADGAVAALMVTAKSTAQNSINKSFVLQVFERGRQVWTWLPEPGVYIGVALDAAARYAYATNSTSNRVYRIQVGDSKAPVTEIAALGEAEQIGALALDSAESRLFVADSAAGRVFVVPLSTLVRPAVIRLPGYTEIRAVAWSASTQRLLVADAGNEAVWVADAGGTAEPVAIRDKRLRAPAGVIETATGQVWVVDEVRNAVLQLQLQGVRSIVRSIDLD